MVHKNVILLGMAALSLGVLLIGQGTGITQTKDKTLKVVPPPYSQPQSGKQMYKDYCAACHGMEGKGNGPAVEFLKASPPDLTIMAKGHNDTYVTDHVRTVLRFGTESKAHGTLDMPLWGQMFSALNSHDDAVVKLRINNLCEYVQSIQQK